jgi:hypothetical protein
LEGKFNQFHQWKKNYSELKQNDSAAQELEQIPIDLPILCTYKSCHCNIESIPEACKHHGQIGELDQFLFDWFFWLQ